MTAMPSFAQHRRWALTALFFGGVSIWTSLVCFAAGAEEPGVAAASLPSTSRDDPERISRLLRTPNGRHRNILKLSGQFDQCTAVLIAPRWAMTLAHCIDGDSSQLFVTFGANDAARSHRIRVTNTVVAAGGLDIDYPETYDRSMLKKYFAGSALALLQLELPLTAPAVRIFGHEDFEAKQERLGDASIGQRQTYDFVTVGWGRFPHEPETKSFNVQRYVPSRVVPISNCFEGFSTEAMKILDAQFVCAAHTYVDVVPCQGFSGGPLLGLLPAGGDGIDLSPADRKRPGALVAVGLVAGGAIPATSDPCAHGPISRQRPLTAYRKVWPMANWIQRIVRGSVAGDVELKALPQNSSISGKSDIVAATSVAPPEDGDPLNMAMDGEFPFMVSIGLTKERVPTLAHKCGGVVVDRYWVLTAAHCVAHYENSPRDVSVKLMGDNGSHQLNLKSPRRVADDIRVFRFGGSEYRQDAAFKVEFNDIALVKVAEIIPANACPTRVGGVEALSTLVATYREGMVIGWGANAFAPAPVSNVRLRKLRMPLLQWDRCQATTPWRNLVNERMICAGDKTKDSCQGDSGGPLLIYDSDGQAQLLGLVSFGKEECASDWPGVYTFVPAFKAWFDSIVPTPAAPCW